MHACSEKKNIEENVSCIQMSNNMSIKFFFSENEKKGYCKLGLNAYLFSVVWFYKYQIRNFIWLLQFITSLFLYLTVHSKAFYRHCPLSSSMNQHSRVHCILFKCEIYSIICTFHRWNILLKSQKVNAIY